MMDGGIREEAPEGARIAGLLGSVSGPTSFRPRIWAVKPQPHTHKRGIGRPDPVRVLHQNKLYLGVGSRQPKRWRGPHLDRMDSLPPTGSVGPWAPDCPRGCARTSPGDAS